MALIANKPTAGATNIDKLIETPASKEPIYGFRL
jgi:hypothetical protein